MVCSDPEKLRGHKTRIECVDSDKKNCILVNESIKLDVQSEQSTSLHMTDFRLVEMWRVLTRSEVWSVTRSSLILFPDPSQTLGGSAFLFAAGGVRLEGNERRKHCDTL